jgi:hypothetical protein
MPVLACWFSHSHTVVIMLHCTHFILPSILGQLQKLCCYKQNTQNVILYHGPKHNQDERLYAFVHTTSVENLLHLKICEGCKCSKNGSQELVFEPLREVSFSTFVKIQVFGQLFECLRLMKYYKVHKTLCLLYIRAIC